MYHKRVKFDFDPAKSAATKADPNRGFDFVEVQAIWLDPNAITVPAKLKDGEARWMMIGSFGPRVVAVVFTERSEGVIRIISARPARENEREFYEEQKG